MLELKQQTFYILDYRKLNELMSKELNTEFDIVANEQWNNDSCYNSDTSTNFIKEAEYFSNKESWPADMCLAYLADKSIIPHGDYLIKVCW